MNWIPASAELGEVFDLARAQKEGWSLSRAVGALVTVCQTVAYAHAKHVIHRVLNPSNVMVGRFGEVHVMDWGLAKVLDRADLHEVRLQHAQDVSLAPNRSSRPTDGSSASQSRLLTTHGSVVGTPAYMAPEQAKGQLEKVDALSDVYSLGAILYRLLVGHAPFQEPGTHLYAGALLGMVVEGPPAAVLAARHRPRALPRVRARDRARLRGDQARLGPREFQLLHQRDGFRLHPGRGGDRRERRLAAPAALPVRAVDRPLVRHAGGTAEPPLSLREVRFTGGGMTWPSHRRTAPESALAGYLAEARRLIADPSPPTVAPERLVVDADFETLRWFPLPAEVARRQAG